MAEEDRRDGRCGSLHRDGSGDVEHRRVAAVNDGSERWLNELRSIDG
jgi:hypothetical protein